MIEFENIKQLISKYTDEVVIEHKIDERYTCYGERDIRYFCIVTLYSGKKIFFKICSNIFTTLERVEAWANLAYQYKNQVGIYTPLFLKTKDGLGYGTIIEINDKVFVAWAEEFAMYTTIDDKENELENLSTNIKEGFLRQISKDEFIYHVGEVVGKVCNYSKKNNSKMNWTTYDLFHKFCDYDTYGKYYEFALYHYNYIKESNDINISLWTNIWNIYSQKRAKLEIGYDKLPSGVVQGDLLTNNILIDEENTFAGIIDFNTSGNGVFIFFAMKEAIFHSFEFIEGGEINDELCIKGERRLKTFFKGFMKHYEIQKSEKESINLLYNIIRPFCVYKNRYTRELLGEKQFDIVNKRMEWMYYELTRNDIAGIILNS